MKTKQVWYLAHPVSYRDGLTPLENCYNAIRWIRWFAQNEPSRVYVAPWIPEVIAFEGVPKSPGGPGTWDRALEDDEHVIRHLDGIVMVGGRISPGMQREWDCARAAQKWCLDLSQYRTPEDLPDGFLLEEASDE